MTGVGSGPLRALRRPASPGVLPGRHHLQGLRLLPERCSRLERGSSSTQRPAGSDVLVDAGVNGRRGRGRHRVDVDGRRPRTGAHRRPTTEAAVERRPSIRRAAPAGCRSGGRTGPARKREAALRAALHADGAHRAGNLARRRIPERARRLGARRGPGSRRRRSTGRGSPAGATVCTVPWPGSSRPSRSSCALARGGRRVLRRQRRRRDVGRPGAGGCCRGKWRIVSPIGRIVRDAGSIVRRGRSARAATGSGSGSGDRFLARRSGSRFGRRLRWRHPRPTATASSTRPRPARARTAASSEAAAGSAGSLTSGSAPARSRSTIGSRLELGQEVEAAVGSHARTREVRRPSARGSSRRRRRGHRSASGHRLGSRAGSEATTGSRARARMRRPRRGRRHHRRRLRSRACAATAPARSIGSATGSAGRRGSATGTGSAGQAGSAGPCRWSCGVGQVARGPGIDAQPPTDLATFELCERRPWPRPAGGRRRTTPRSARGGHPCRRPARSFGSDRRRRSSSSCRCTGGSRCRS